MWRVGRSILVFRPVDEVFGYLTDFARHGEWDGYWGMEIAKTSPGPVAVGFTCERHATFEYESQYTGEKERSVSAVMQLRVTEFVPSERLAYERKIRGTPLATDLLAFEVKPTINGTRTTLRGYESTPRWPWTLSPFWPVLKLGASWALGRYLRRIKERVESTKS